MAYPFWYLSLFELCRWSAFKIELKTLRFRDRTHLRCQVKDSVEHLISGPRHSSERRKSWGLKAEGSFDSRHAVRLLSVPQGVFTGSGTRTAFCPMGARAGSGFFPETKRRGRKADHLPPSNI
jgi:hypothetical protein